MNELDRGDSPGRASPPFVVGCERQGLSPGRARPWKDHVADTVAAAAEAGKVVVAVKLGLYVQSKSRGDLTSRKGERHGHGNDHNRLCVSVMHETQMKPKAGYVLTFLDAKACLSVAFPSVPRTPASFR